jgi:hypothetical protein
MEMVHEIVVLCRHGSMYVHSRSTTVHNQQIASIQKRREEKGREEKRRTLAKHK